MTTDPSAPVSRGAVSGEPVWTLPRLGAALIVALLAQIVVGVANALWLNVPTSGNAWSTSSPSWLVDVHMVVGVVLLVLAVWVAVQAGRERDRTWTAASLVGIVGIVVGFAGGVIFMSADGNAVSSFAMAIGCVISIAAYTVALTQRPQA